MIDAKYFVLFIVLMQRTCNISNQWTNILDNPRHIVRHYGRTSAWPVVIVYRLSPFYRAFVPLKTSLPNTDLVPACPFKFFVGMCLCITNICTKFNDRSYFQTFSDWHFHVITILTTSHKCLFTYVTTGQMTSNFIVTVWIRTHTFPWILTFICSV
jgi:hypothetical protein